MRAWRVHDVGEPEDVFVREDVDEPTPAGLARMGMSMGGWVPLEDAPHPITPEWAILEMRAAALALPDVTMARGTYPVPVPRPYISGQEGVGIVRQTSPGLTHLVGTRVVGVCIQPWGSLADVAVAIAPSVAPAPDGLDDADAAAFLIPAHTAYHAVIRRGQVGAGETVLVTGAAGGLGSACVQLAAARGARVIAAVGSEKKARHCRALGVAGTALHARRRDVPEHGHAGRRVRRGACGAHRDGGAPHDRAPGRAHRLSRRGVAAQLRSVVPLSAPVCSPCSMKRVPLTIVAS